MVHGCRLAEPCLHMMGGLVHAFQDRLREWASAGLEGSLLSFRVLGFASRKAVSYSRVV